MSSREDGENSSGGVPPSSETMTIPRRATNVANADQIASQEDADEFVSMVKEMQSRRDQWQDELVELFRREDEQDKEAKKLLREALVNEAEYCSDAAFVKFRAEHDAKFGQTASCPSSLTSADKENIIASSRSDKQLAAVQQLQQDRQSASTGQPPAATASKVTVAEFSMTSSHDRLTRWFEMDELLALTPFAGVVPVPASITSRMKGVSPGATDLTSQRTTVLSSLVEEINELFPTEDIGIVFEACPLLPSSRTLVEPEAEEIAPFLSYTDQEMKIAKNGEELMSFVEKSLVYQTALCTTPCLFLSDHKPVLMQHKPAQGLFVRCFIIKGTLIASEILSFSQDNFTHSKAMMLSLKTLLSEKVTPALRCNNYVASFRFNPETMKDGAKLLNVSPLEPTDYALFSWRELQDLVQALVGRERRERTGLSRTTGEDVGEERYGVMDKAGELTSLGNTVNLSNPSSAVAAKKSEVKVLSTAETAEKNPSNATSFDATFRDKESVRTECVFSPVTVPSAEEQGDGTTVSPEPLKPPSPEDQNPQTSQAKNENQPTKISDRGHGTSEGLPWKTVGIAIVSAVLASALTGIVALKIVKRSESRK